MKNVIYTAGRFLTVITKPLCLYVINNYLSNEIAADVATAFIATAFSVAFISADPHRRFYQSFFTKYNTSTTLSFYSYIINIVFLIFLGCFCVIGLIQRSTNSTVLAISCIFYFVSEKIADEIFRFKLFERRLTMWGAIALARSTTQVTTLVLLMLLVVQRTQAYQIIAAMALANFITFIVLIFFLREPPYDVLVKLNLARLKIVMLLIPRSLRLLYIDWILWLMTIVAAGSRYLDRFIVLFIDQSALPIFSLVTMCFSIVPLSVDFFYTSRHRRDFLEHRIVAKNAFRSTRFNSTLFIPVIAAILATVFILSTANNAAEFPNAYVITIAFTNVSLAAISLPHQILYWTNCLPQIFIIDFSFLGLSSLAVFLGYRLNLSAVTLLWIAAILSVLRLLSYFLSSLQVSQKMISGS